MNHTLHDINFNFQELEDSHEPNSDKAAKEIDTALSRLQTVLATQPLDQAQMEKINELLICAGNYAEEPNDPEEREAFRSANNAVNSPSMSTGAKVLIALAVTAVVFAAVAWSVSTFGLGPTIGIMIVLLSPFCKVSSLSNKDNNQEQQADNHKEPDAQQGNNEERRPGLR